MTFLLLAIQSTVCVLCVMAAKKAKFVRFRPLNIDDAKAWFPISVLLVSVIYTGSKSLVSAFYLLLRSPLNWLAIFEYTGLHDFQEPYYYTYCL